MIVTNFNWLMRTIIIHDSETSHKAFCSIGYFVFDGLVMCAVRWRSLLYSDERLEDIPPSTPACIIIFIHGHFSCLSLKAYLHPIIVCLCWLVLARHSHLVKIYNSLLEDFSPSIKGVLWIFWRCWAFFFLDQLDGWTPIAQRCFLWQNSVRGFLVDV